MAAMTIKAIEAAKPGMHVDGGAKGLYLKVSDGGSRSWIYRFQLNGKRREMGLGTYPGKGAADARAEAATLATAVKAGIDPIEQRRAAVLAQQQAAEAVKVEEIRKVTTFAEVAKQFIDGKADGWRNPKHADQWRNTLSTYCVGFNDKPVAEVGIDDAEAALRPIWLSKTETATRVLDRIVCVINYAADKRLRDDDAASWPRRLRENRLPMLPKKRERVRHHPALPYARLPEFMAALRQSPAIGSRALEFAILCASRSSEVRLATWQEIDLDAALWVIPGSRMKAKQEHRVPLSSRAVELLRALPQGEPSNYVFPAERSGKELSDMTLCAFVKRQNSKGATWVNEAGETVTQHGFRSTFSTWASETTPFPGAVVEMALAHTISNAVEAAYRRGDLFEKRRELMQAWSNFIMANEQV